MRSNRLLQSLQGVVFALFILTNYQLSAQSPGGVNSNFKLWLKANTGVTGTSTVTGWADQSGNGFNATSPGNAPQLLTNQLNFNPVIDFTSASTQYMQITNGIMGASAYTNAWVYVVSKADINQNQTVFFEALAGGESFDGLLPWSTTAYYDFGNNGAGRVSGAWGGSFNNYNIWTLGSGATAASTPNGTNKIISRDGAVILSNNNNDATIAGNNQNFLIGTGYNSGLNNPFDGKIAEIIIYNGIPSPLEQEKIQSYLAIKYGITKNSADVASTAGQDERDYFASNGAVIWQYAANAAYNNNVTGIGLDNTSQLAQQKSLSANAGAKVTLTGNISNNLSFIVWGDNNAANGTSTDTPGGYAKRINKVFKTNVTGTPGLVNFSIDLTDLGLPIGLNATDYALLLDADGVFNSGATIHTTGAAISNGQLSFTNVPFTNGSYFTVAVTTSALKGPANVTDNLKLWLRANTGVTGTSPVTDWADQSGNAYNATSPGLGPDLLTNQINFNPVLDFTTTSSEYMQVTNGIMGSSSYTDAWVYTVSKADIVQDQTVFYEALAGGETFNGLMPWGNANIYLDFGATGGSGRINGAWGGNVNNYYLWTLGSSASAAAAPNGTNKIVSRDGTVILSNNNNDATIAGNNQNFLIGGGYNNGLGTTRPFDGKIAEMIIFTGVPSPLDQEKIQSYLAVKYGLTKSSADVAATAGQDERDYFASNGTSIWRYAANATYHNRVTGIGRDDASQLSQQKSSSPYTGSVLTIDKTTSFGSNLSYIVTGDDNGVLSSTNTGVPSPYTARATRIWKTNVTGSPGAISISFDLSSGLHNSGNVADYALLIKNSNTSFNSGATIITAGASLVNNVLTFPNVTLTDGDFFTLGLAVTTPGGVAGSVFWVKGGSGVTGTSNVSIWADQSGNGNNSVQNIAANQPSLVTNDINFNSSINFSGGTTMMSPVTPPANLNSTVFTVAVPIINTNWRTMFRGSAGDHPLIIQSGGINLGYYDNDNGGMQNSGFTWLQNETALVELEMRAGDVNFRKNGSQGSSITSIDLTGLNLNYFGNYQGNNQQFGRIGETIIYNTASPLSATEKNKIESYLAIKYGVTLTHDYITTGGTTTWNVTTNSTYSNGITGIGRDDVTALDQRKSKSTVTGSVLTVEKTTPGNAFSTNQNFLIVGDDAGTLSATTVGVAPGFPMRVSRIWRTQLTGTPGTVNITFDLGTGIYKSATATDYSLLISNSASFGSSTPITGGVLGANTITFSNVSLNDGAYFTLGLPFINSPGNVINNLKVWLRADLNVYSDAGTTAAVDGGSVSQWNDQTSLGNNGAATATPLYNTTSNLINFNPTIYYDGTSGHNLTYSVSDQYTIFTMAKMEGTQNGRVWSSRNSNSLLGYWNGREDVLYLNGTPSILGGQAATTNPRMYSMSRASNGAYTFLKNGATLSTGAAGSSNNTTWQMGIANGGQYSGEKSKVYISEMIIYDRNLSTAEINSVQSYLAVKYGVTLDQSTPTNYVSADGTVIWDATSGPVGNASYRNNIAGIGRDDASKLNQLKSQSINTRAIIQIEKQGGSFVSDKTFLMWGADDNTLSPTSVGTYPGYPYRLAKAWRVDQTGTTGLVSVSFDLSVGIFNTGNAADYGLAIKNANADFSSGATVNNNSSPLPPVFNGNVITFRNVTFADGDYFTLVLPNIPAPGGVVGNVQLWLKGNSGVTDAGGVASAWTDQSGNGFNVTQNNASARPAIQANQSNFNPAIKFDGTDDQLSLTGGIMGTGTYNDFNAIIVSRAAANATNTQLYEAQASGGRINMHIPWNNNNIYWDAGDAGTNRLNTNWNGVLNTNYLWTLTSSVSGTASGAKKDIFRNGLRIANNNAQNSFTGNNSTFYLGSQAGNNFTNGDISEIVLYTGNLTSNQLQRINSYMSIKYGLTLDQATPQNYLSSTSAVIYHTTTTHGAYVYNIGGIGRDDNSALDQRKSQSQDTPLDIFTASNKDFTTPGAFDNNLQFLIWGNNGLATSSDASTPAVTHAGSSIVRRLARVWSTDKTGTPSGNLFIEMELGQVYGPSGPGTNAAADVRLLLDDDATFGNASAGEKIYSTSSVAGTKLYFSVPYSDIPSQSFLTVGSVNIATAPLFTPTPGGIAANMRLWLKGDNGATAASWTDFSGNGFNATQANVGNQPSILTNRVNFNPSVVFNGSNQNFSITNGILRSATYNDAHVFVISRVNTIQNSQLLYENSATSQFVTYIPWGNSNVYWDAGDNSANRLNGAWGASTGQPYLWSLLSSTTTTPLGTKQDIYRNGIRFLNKSTMFSFSGNNSTLYLGSGPNSNYYNGEISEVVVVGSNLTTSQFQRVQTYLAIKYGITLDQLTAQNYTASTDAVIYHATTSHINYRNDITGIGRDDNSALDQRKSKNINQTPDVIAVANGDFTTPTAFANSLEFLVWGHNGLPYAADAATATYTHNGAAIVRQLARVWSSDKTNSPSGNAVFEMDMSLIGGPGGVAGANANADVRLLIDNDVTFGNSSAGERAYSPDAGYTTTGGKIYFTVPYSQIQSGQGFFTLGSVNISTAPISIPYPGGVATNIKLWLKADAGTNSNVNGSSISSWADRSGNGFTATQATAGSQPTFTTGAINFNPGLTFNGSTNQMQITSGILGTGTYTDVNAYVIGTVSTAPKNQSAFWENTASGGRLNVHTPEGTNLVWDPGSTTYRLSTNWGGVINTPYLWSFAASTTATQSGARTDIFRNALRIANANTMASFVGNNSSTYIGSIGNNYYYGGVISEEVIYTGALTTTQQNRIHSYLALKYGLTLDQTTAQDYFASNGTILYHATTTHNSYKIEIGGIGRDDDSGLDQRKSKSINANSIITMEKTTPGSAFVTDKDFIIWGDDGLSNAPTTIGAVNATYPTRITKTWRVDTNGTPGTATVSFNLNAGIYNSTVAANYALLIKNADNDFTTGATVHTTGVTINSGVLTFTNVNFADNDFFTLAMPRPPAPGGVVNNLKLWLKANAGVYSDAGVTPATNAGSVQQWTDQTQLGNNGSATGTPIYNTVSNTINFNPTVYYDGSSGHNLTYSVSGQYTIFTMSKMEGTQNRRLFSSRASNYLIGYWNGRENVLYMNNVPNLLTGVAASTTPRLYALTRANTGAYQMFNSGASLYSGGAGSSNDPVMQWSIGNGGQSNESSKAYVSESIIYDRNLNTAELSAVQSYLAIKYGITIDQTAATNYVTADGTVTWNGTTNVSYKNDIAGIGRDDRSALDQRKSKSINTNSAVIIEKTSSFATDKDFMTWGADANVLAPTSVGVHASYPYRVTKAWRVQLTGAPGVVNVSFDLNSGIYNSGNANDYGLMIKNADANFSTGSVALNNSGSSPAPTLVGGILTFYNISFTNGDYFSLALPIVPAPGGVVNGMQLWVKANTGVTGTSVSAWADQSGNGFNITQATAANQPALLSNDINFNPSVQFDGINDQLTWANGIIGTSTYNNLNTFMLTRVNAIAASSIFYEAQSSGGRINAHVPWNDNILYWDAGSTNTANQRLQIAWGGAVNTNYLWSLTASTTATPSGARQDIYRNGLRIANDANMASFTGNNSTLYVGSNGSGNYYNGEVAENVIYTSVLTLPQFQRIQSYFAVKYGVTLNQTTAQSYYASDWNGTAGTLIWDATAAGTYKNDIAAIGRDDYSALSQKQSASLNAGNILTIGNNAIATDNASNSNAFGADKSFFSWAHNNLNISTWTVTDFGTTVNGQTLQGRIARVWFAKETGTVGSLKLRFDLSAVPGVNNVPGDNELANVRLLVDADGVFATGATSVNSTTYNNTTDIIEFDYDFGAATGFYFTLATTNMSNAPLPIELISFEAIPTNEGAVVRWATESELNSDYFVVQVSQDGTSWGDVTTVKGQGTKKARTDYEILDANPFIGRSYYRLKQVDLDRKINYSNVVSVDFEAGEIQLYPNPTSGTFKLKTSDISGEVQSVRVMNLQGTEVIRQTFASNSGRIGEQSIDVSSLAAATYIVLVQTTTKSYQIKLVVVH